VLRGARVQGPYSSAQLSRYLLLGRVRYHDELSCDGQHWRPLLEYPELIPDELYKLHSPQGWQRYLDALAEVDERGDEQPHGSRQRRGDQSRHRFREEWRAALRSAGLGGGERCAMPLLLLGVTLAALLVLLIFGSVSAR